MLLPVVTCFSVSSLIAPASTTSCMLLKREPSFSSMNVTPLESRRERTQPRRMISLPTDALKACLTERNSPILPQYRFIADNVNRGGGAFSRAAQHAVLGRRKFLQNCFTVSDPILEIQYGYAPPC